ncbi:MAG TPA: TIGR04282 family arsenosugar biosynthesis glycosyltransferase [Thermodesulfobacteriota bacterium]|nr:TIGR04282 family arsenosugar biosynthesis glycosyltransferase [Thermodesulfobacteriota bacterium]
MNKRHAVAVMVKVPEPGYVKTRLVPALTEVEAAGLYECFLKDIFGKLSMLEHVDLFAAYTPRGHKKRIAGLLPDGVGLMPQKGNSLGDRMYNVFRRLLVKGYKRVLVLGSDSPDLPLGYVEDAFRCLGEKGSEMVLGPALDGGYYLVAMDILTRIPFTGISWSTDRVLKETLKRARQGNINARLIEPWHDIDTPGDIDKLRGNEAAPESARFIGSLKSLQ